MAGGLRNVNAVVTITTNAVKAIEDGKKLKEVYAAINQQLNLMRAEGKTDTTEFKEMQKLAEDTKLKIDALVTGMKLIRGVVDNLANKQGRDLNRALRETAKEFNRTANDTDKHKAKLEQLRQSVAALKRELSDRKGLTMSFTDAQKQLQNLANTPLDKLRAGLASIRAELEGDINSKTRSKLQSWENQYAAQIAIKETGTIPSSSLAGVQQADRTRLEAERKRLVDAYNVASMSEDKQHIQWSNLALQRVQALNGALKQLNEEEQKRDKATRDAAAVKERFNQAERVSANVATGTKQSIQDLTDAYKNYGEYLRTVEGVNQPEAERVKANMQNIKQALTDISQIDVQKTINSLTDPNATTSLEQMEEALKKLKENAATIGIHDDIGFQKYTEDVEKLEAAIDQVKLKLQGLADIDYAHLENYSTEKLQAELKNLEAQEKKLSGTQKKEAELVARKKTLITDQLKKNEVAVIDFANAEKIASERGKHSVTEMQIAYDALKAKLVNLAANEKEAIKQTRKQMDQLKKDINSVTGEVSGLQKVWKSAVRNIATYAGLFAGFGFIKSKIQEVVKSTLSLSDSMTQVRKVTGLTKKEVDALNVSFAKLDSRTALTELNDLAYSAGKMGLGKYGLEGVRQFVEATNQLQVALGEDLGNSVEESITPLAKLAENLGLIQKMGVEKSMLAIGSSINELSQTTTAVGKNIVDFARRIQPSAQMIGLTTDEILALGSASDAFGIASEISATAFTKFLAAYRTNTAEIERILGMAKGSLDEFFDNGRTIDGLMAIFQRMHDIGDLRYLQEAFKALGSEGSRMFTTFGAFSKNIDMFRSHLETSTKAFREATSVTREYGLVQDTAAGILERANNIWEKAFVNPEGVDLVKEFAKAWYDVSKALTTNFAAMTELKFLLAGVMELVKGIVYLLPALMNGLMIFGGARLFAFLKGALEINTITNAVKGLTFSLGALKTAWTALSTVGKANWIGAIATAIFVAVEAVGAFNKKIEQATGYMRGFDKTLGDLNTQYGNGEMELRRYRRAIDEATTGTKQRAAAIAQFNSKFKGYMSNLLTEKSTALDVAKAYQEICNQMRAKMALELREKDREKYVKPREQWTIQRREEYDQLMKNTPRSEYSGEWLSGYLQDAKANKKNWKQIAKDLNDSVFHVTQSSFDSVMKQLNSGTFNELVTKTVKMGSGKKSVQELMGPNAKQLWAAMRYVLQDLSTDNAYKVVDNKYKPEEKRIADYLASQEVRQNNISIEPTPTGGGVDTGTSEKDRELKDKFDETKKNVEGLIAKIDEWYNLQEAAVRDAQAMGELSKKEADDLVTEMQIVRNESLMRARKAVGTGNDEAIEDWKLWAKTVMPALIADSSEWSKSLMTTIQEVDAKALHDFLATLKEQTNDPKLMAMLDASSFFDTIMKKSAENKKKAEVLRAQFKENLDKYLKQYDFIATAQEKMRDDLQSLGFMTETPEEMAKRVSEGRDKENYKAASGREYTDQELYSRMGTKFIGQGTIPYTIDITNQQEALQWLKQFATDAKGELEEWAQAFPQIVDWVNRIKEAEKDGTIGEAELKSLEDAMPQIEALYLRMINYSDNIGKVIQQRVNAMVPQTGIGVEGMRETAIKRNQQTENEWNKEIEKADANGDIASAIELERQKEQALLAIEYDYQEQLYQIRQQMGVNWGEELEHEIAMYQNMLDRQLISEQQFQQKKKQLQATTGMKYAQYFNDQMKSLVDALQSYEIQATENKYDAQIQAAQAAGQSTTALEEEKEAAIYEIRRKYAAMDLAIKISEIGVNTALAIMNAYATLPYPAAIAANVMLVALGAAQTALAIAEYQKVMGSGASSSKSGAKTNVKLASGMLTYDEGNVGMFAGRRKLYDDGTTQVYDREGSRPAPFVGQDGHVYMATPRGGIPEGVSLVKQPIATTVNGQPALVAEKGPEIVIGRRTTARIMMNEPRLLHHLATLGNGRSYGGYRGLRTFDEGNLGETVGSVAVPQQQSERDQRINAALAANAAALEQNAAAMAAFSQVMQQIQANGIQGVFREYGAGSLDESMRKVNAFRRRYPTG